MKPEVATLLSALIVVVGGWATVWISRRDRHKERQARGDAKIMQVEQGAFARATASDVDLINRLNERIAKAENRAAQAEQRAEEAERKNVALATRVYRLELAMAAAGLDLPA